MRGIGYLFFGQFLIDQFLQIWLNQIFSFNRVANVFRNENIILLI